MENYYVGGGGEGACDKYEIMNKGLKRFNYFESNTVRLMK